jgi:hypothetical protein
MSAASMSINEGIYLFNVFYGSLLLDRLSRQYMVFESIFKVLKTYLINKIAHI